MPVKVKVKQTGRVRKPTLDNGQLTRIGNQMVDEQKLRWSQAINADGHNAQKLSVRYAILKQQKLRKRPKRDNQMTGMLVRNFTLRKAIDNVIRAENTTREARKHAERAQGYEQMIGFSGKDTVDLLRQVQQEYGVWAKKAWYQVNG